MIVLHGIWKPPETLKDRGDFFLWGESSSISPVKRRGRPPKAGTQRPHPFQATEKDLKRVVESLNSGHDISEKARSDNVLLLLPSLPGSPQASPDLLRDDGAENVEESVSLSHWKVNGLSIQPEDAIILFSSLSGTWIESDAAMGTDLRFWSKVSKFAMELLSKQHFIPGIVF